MRPISILGAGMVSAVGLNAASSCAAIRCALDNFRETRFIDQGGEWLLGASVELEQSWLGRSKLLKMACRALLEAVQAAPLLDPSQTPLLLCLAEPERPGRLSGLDQSLLADIQSSLGLAFHPASNIIARGRVSAAVALLNARQLLESGHPQVLIVGVDSFLQAESLSAYEQQRRLLTSQHSNGFIPGEAAAAVLIGPALAHPEPQLLCLGLGFSREPAPINSDAPLRAQGLSQATQAALAEAGFGLEAFDYRLTDISGEQYYFKEASLALSRTLRVRKEEFPLQHPSDCIGEVGAAIGPAMLAVALAAAEKNYALGPKVFCHLGNDAGERAAVLLSYQPLRSA